MTIVPAIICGWCQLPLSPVKVLDGKASHGMCPKCKAEWEAKLKGMK